jgi:hypothetical protein
MEPTEIMSVSNVESREAVVYDKSLESIILEAEKKVDVLKKVLGVAIKRTNPHDWTCIGDKPYLGSSGLEKIAPLFGCKMEDVKNVRLEREDEKGKHYIYQFTARFFWQGGSIEALGACSSRDKFFGYDSTKKIYKELHDVDETNVMKAAYSNLMVNGIGRLLGIRNLEWSDLEPFGITKDKVSKVEYNKGASADPANAGLITEAQVKRFYSIAKSCGWADAELKEWLLKNYKLDSATKISWKDKQYENIIIAVQKAKGIEQGA